MPFTDELGLEKITDGQEDAGDSLNANVDILDLGLSRRFPLSENGTEGDVFYKNSSGDATKAKSDDLATTKPILGILTTTGITNDERRFRYTGKHVKAGWGLIANSIYYISPSTAGAITTTKPSPPNHPVIIGYTGDLTTTLYIDFSGGGGISGSDYFYYDVANSYLQYGDQAITSILFNEGVIENGFIVSVLNESRIVSQGSTMGILNLVDTGATADYKIFEIVKDGDDTVIRALKDNGTVQKTFMAFEHDTGNIDFKDNALLDIASLAGGGDAILLGDDLDGLTNSKVLYGAKLGIGTSDINGTAGVAHIAAAVNADTNWYANAPLIVENTNHVYINIRTPNNRVGGIMFSDPDAEWRGLVDYAHSNDQLSFYTAGSLRMHIREGIVYIAGSLNMTNGAITDIASLAGGGDAILCNDAFTIADELNIGDTADKLRLRDSGTSAIIDAVINNLILRTSSAKAITFETNGANVRMRIQSDGNIDLYNNLLFRVAEIRLNNGGKVMLNEDGGGDNYVISNGDNVEIWRQGQKVMDFVSDGIEFPNVNHKITSISGRATKFTNKTGSNTNKGQLVRFDPSVDDAVVLTASADDECVGVFLDAGIANDAEAWVVTEGMADIAFDDNVGAARGNWVGTGAAGYARTQAAPPALGVAAHFEEVGHCMETVAAGGGGTNILARCKLQFN